MDNSKEQSSSRPASPEVPLSELTGSKAIAGVEAFAKRENELSSREQKGEDVEEERYILEKEEEVYFFERDPSGALVRDRWGVDSAERFKEKVEMLDESGQIKAEAEDALEHSIMIGMGELDRINDEGGHGGGDIALEHTHRVIEKALAQIVAEHADTNADFEVYRFGGNQYAVEMTGVPQAAIDKLMAGFRDMGPEQRMPEALKDSLSDAPPIMANSLNRAELVGMMNRVQEVLARPETQASPIGEGKDMQRALVDLAARAGDLNMEIDKFTNRCDRMMEKLGRGDGDIDKFFEQYMKKGLDGSGFDSVDSFKEWSGKIVAAEGEEKAGLQEKFRELVSKEAYASAGRWLAKEQGTELMKAEVIMAVLGEDHQIEIPKPEEMEAADFKEFRRLPPRELKGKKLVGEMKERADKLQETDPESIEARKATVDLKLERVRRDAATGLEKRRAHYLDLRSRLNPDEKGELADVSVVFIDMGFLKYFDREGGRAVGDKAIEEAVSMMEQAQAILAEEGIEIDLRRYGGDEFTMTVDGGPEASKKVTDTLARLQLEGPPIPRAEGSSAKYVDSPLSFNFGTASTENMSAVEQRLRERGLAPKGVDDDPAALAKWRSELLTELADAGIREQKASGRMMKLFQRMTDEDAYKQELQERGYSPEQIDGGIDALIDYSQKAIFNHGKDLREWVKNENIGVDELSSRTREIIEQKTGQDIQEKREKNLVVDLVIEHGVREARLEAQLREYRQEMERLKSEGGEKDRRMAELQQRIEASENEKKELLQKFLGEG